MKFLSLHHTDAPYRQALGDQNIIGFGVHNQNESIGKVVDILVDDAERSYYVAVERHAFLLHERFLLPLTACQFSASEQRIYVTGLDKQQIKNLPPYRREHVTPYAGSYASGATATAQVEPLPVEASLPLEYSRPLEGRVNLVNTEAYGTVVNPVTPTTTHSAPVAEHQATPVPLVVTPTPVETNTAANPIASVEKRPDYVAGIPVEQHNIPLLAERLIIDRKRRKVGEVVLRKVVETQMVSVPVRRERLIVEQVSPERKSLAAIDLDRGELSQEELRRLIPDASDHAIQTVANQVSGYTSSTQAVPIHTAAQILHQVNQVPQFKQGKVKLVFEDQDLQDRYQRWLAEHK